MISTVGKGSSARVGLFFVGCLPQGPFGAEPILDLRDLSSTIRSHIARDGWTGEWEPSEVPLHLGSETGVDSYLDIDERLIRADEIGAVSIPFSSRGNPTLDSEIRLAGYRDRLGSFQASSTVAIDLSPDLLTAARPWSPYREARALVLETLKGLNLAPSIELTTIRPSSIEGRPNALTPQEVVQLPRVMMDVPSASVLAGSRVRGNALLLRVADRPWEQYVLITPIDGSLTLTTEFSLIHQYREGLRHLLSSLHNRIESNEDGKPSLRDVLKSAFSTELGDLLALEQVPVSKLRETLQGLARVQFSLEKAAEELDQYTARRDLLATFAGLYLEPILTGRMDSELERGMPLISKDLDDSIRSRFQTPTNLLLQEVRQQIRRATEFSGSVAALLAGRIDLMVSKRLEWVQYYALATALVLGVLTILVALFHLGV